MTDVISFNPSGTVASLVVFEEARRAIADAETVEQINKILALTAGLAAAARKAADRQIEAEAAVLKLEAERKLGQLMEARRKTVGFSKGGRPKTRIPENPVSGKPPTLREAGIGKNLADKARKAAAMPESEFKKAVEDKRGDLSRPKPPRRRKRRFDAERYAFRITEDASFLVRLLEEHEQDFEDVLDRLLDNVEILADLATLAAHPKVAELVAKVAALSSNPVEPPPDAAVADPDLDISAAGGIPLRGRGAP